MYQIVNHKKGDFNITTDFERIVFSLSQNVSKLTVLPVRRMTDIMSIAKS